MRHSRLFRFSLFFSLSAGCGWGQYVRGVNLAGAEFGENSIPGVVNHDYTYNSESSFSYFGGKGLSLIRLPVRWERLQPVLRGPLDPANLAALKQDLAWAAAHGVSVNIDIQNFGRYKMKEGGATNEYIIDNLYNGVVKVSAADLADLWVKLSTELKSNAAVNGYDLMNEPHDMGSASWKTVSQTVVTAIRNNQDNKLILVPGDSYSSGNRWVSVNGPQGWIVDPANNFKYEAHQYFDRDESGSYAASYDAELARNPNLGAIGQTRVSHFTEWCKSNNVSCYLGEFGIPGNDPRWDAVLDGFLSTIDAAGLDGTYWAAGEWWGSYPLSVQPLNNFTIDAPLLGMLEKHLGPTHFATMSAATTRVLSVSPGSLASGFGGGLAMAPESAPSLPLPTSLGGTNVDLMAADGTLIATQLLYVSPSQINYLVPQDLRPGTYTAISRSGGIQTGVGTVKIEAIAPSLFSLNGAGYGLAAAQIVRVKADGTQTYEAVAMFDSAVNQFTPVPVDFKSDRLFLLLYGTGFRSHSSVPALTLGSTGVPVSFAGAQDSFPGLDQVNAELPASLAGAGTVSIKLQVDGKSANTVTLAFK